LEDFFLACLELPQSFSKFENLKNNKGDTLMNIEKRSRHKMHAEEREVNQRPQTFMHGFRSAWPIAVACLLACAFASSEPAQANIITPGNPYKVYTYSHDYMCDQFQWIFTINHFAGGGVEPMLDLQANLHYSADNDYTMQSVSSILNWDHQILPLGALPPGYTGLIPYSFNIRIEGSIEGVGWFPNIAATAGGVGYGTTSAGSSIAYNQTFTGEAPPNTVISTALSAGITLFGGPSSRNASGQIVVDPYIYIDPSWEYASYFGVFSPDKNGVWTQVNRDWMTPVPIPGAIWLLGSGLLGLVAIRHRMKK
jgi:hypothetical protein